MSIEIIILEIRENYYFLFNKKKTMIKHTYVCHQTHIRRDRILNVNIYLSFFVFSLNLPFWRVPAVRACIQMYGLNFCRIIYAHKCVYKCVVYSIQNDNRFILYLTSSWKPKYFFEYSSDFIEKFIE